MAVMRVAAFQVTSGNQSAGPHSELFVEWMAGISFSDFESRQTPPPYCCLGYHEMFPAPYAQRPPAWGGPVISVAEFSLARTQRFDGLGEPLFDQFGAFSRDTAQIGRCRRGRQHQK